MRSKTAKLSLDRHLAPDIEDYNGRGAGPPDSPRCALQLAGQREFHPRDLQAGFPPELQSRGGCTEDDRSVQRSDTDEPAGAPDLHAGAVGGLAPARRRAAGGLPARQVEERLLSRGHPQGEFVG